MDKRSLNLIALALILSIILIFSEGQALAA